MDWRQILAMTLIGAGGGNPMQLVAMQQQQKQEAERKNAMMLAGNAITNRTPNVNVSPSVPLGGSNAGFDYGTGDSAVSDVAQHIPALLMAGVDPTAFLNTAKALQPPAQEDYTLGENEIRYRGNQPIARGPAKTFAPDKSGAPVSRTRIEGDKEIFEELDEGTRTWRKVSEGPRWAPNRGNEEAPGITDQGVLRREFNTEAGGFEQVASSTVRLLEAAKDPSAAGDLAVIFNYMKILDPGSVVRETEFATAQNAAGVPEQIRAQWNRLLNGERLSEATRRDFVDRARRLYEGQAQTFDRKVLSRYRDLSARYRIPAENIIQDYRIDLTPYQSLFGAPQAAPAPQSPIQRPVPQPSGNFKNAQDVAAAYRAGRLSRDQAAQILRANGWAE